MTLTTVSWLTESGHPTREHVIAVPGQDETLCGTVVPIKHVTRTDAPRSEVCRACLRKVGK